MTMMNENESVQQQQRRILFTMCMRAYIYKVVFHAEEK